MSPRARRPVVAAEVGDGFVATEAPALQVSIREALQPGEGGRAPSPAELRFEPGAAGRVVVLWRNRHVGFVPPTHREALAAQLATAGKATVQADGYVYRDGELHRIWVGPLPTDGFPGVPPGYDELPVPETTIFGFALRRPTEP
ncbi:hypothetical protein Xcel_1129 [Xylanimonas cellulosilytica DSM 15894]|uniref:HIRAN domain-containing protein n=1 Tax=Xylanimonas cellulosilytica (strain DSM 15894 / JCM 12276 / CECT 5975 / KCTC 9989 / LMG 20990 / NBRC 107835 / XIL07) TaxID=446471 RepID=D1BZK6_XYLCX|nr:hypothetical protein [Xylanimonas cellulosilytica]ACZ30160.1 hypothetical protein Xcel_1129 [Xylanimonas cellulosilytica DSM 15894]